MSTVSLTLTDLVRQAADAAGYADAPVPLEPAVPCGNPAHGDYQSNFAFRLGKRLRTNPRAVAEQIAGALPENDVIASVTVAGPGFLNFRLDSAWLGRQLAAQCDDPRFGLPARSGTVVIDYSSPNVAKRMHVGHLRSTVIGDAIARLHRFAGYQVVADNHIGDWGTMFGKLIVAWGLWLDEDALAADPIGEMQRIYVKFNQAAEDDPTLDDRARAETARLQAGDPDNRALWEIIVRESLKEYQGVYDRFGIAFDVTLGESFYHDMLGPLVESLLESGVAQISDGAAIVPFEGSDGKGLKKNPLLIRKGDGAYLYGTTDLAAVRYRLDTWSPDRIIYLTDMRQQLHFRQLFAACKKLGWDQAALAHVWFGMLSLPEGSMGTRKGNVIHLVDLLDAAVRKARVVVDENSPDLSDDERAAVAERVGVGAVKYADISQNPQSNVVFTWEKMMAMDGNTAPKIMYAYARCRGIQRKGEVAEPHVAPPALVHERERALAVALLRFPEVVEGALDTHRPNLLCGYMFELAQELNRFYDKCNVIYSEGETRESRLALVEAAARVLGSGLRALGLTPLDRM